MTLKVLVHKAEEGGYWAEVPAIKGCFSQGETIDELLENMALVQLGWVCSRWMVKSSSKERPLSKIPSATAGTLWVVK